jgi:hypothetical protein
MLAAALLALVRVALRGAFDRCHNAVHSKKSLAIQSQGHNTSSWGRFLTTHQGDTAALEKLALLASRGQPRKHSGLAVGIIHL